MVDVWKCRRQSIVEHSRRFPEIDPCFLRFSAAFVASHAKFTVVVYALGGCFSGLP
jgi:hypothetical protein